VTTIDRRPAAATPAPDPIDHSTGTALTAEELDLLDHLAHGRTRTSMARLAARSVSQVDKVFLRLYEKLGASNGAHAVAIGFQAGILPAKRNDIPSIVKALTVRYTTGGR
jgi:DNA-binding CsgD family transcriptional regulator